MKTITYNPETHRLVPVEPTEDMFEQMVTALCVADGYKKAVLVAPQPEPVESEGTELNQVEPVALIDGNDERVLFPSDAMFHYWIGRNCTPLYTAPPDYEEIKRQRDEYRKDAERYRVLRDSEYQLDEDDQSVSDSFFNQFFGEDIDVAVDALKARFDAALASVKTNVGSSDEQGGAA